jgi:hypothetical protein
VRLLALAATAVVLAVPATAAAASGTVERARVTMTVEPNGIVDVFEQRLIHAPAPYTAVFDLLMRKGELFAEPAVAVGGRPFRAGDGRTENTFVVSTQAKGIRIAWRQPAGTHSVNLSYRLALRGIAYRDVVDLRVVLWNGGSLRRLDATVALPRTPRRRVYAWFDPKSADAEATTAGRKVVLHARDLSESLSLRVAFPRGILDSTEGTVVRPRTGLPQILADERRSPHNRNWDAIVAGVGLGAGLVAVALVYRSRRRNS